MKPFDEGLSALVRDGMKKACKDFTSGGAGRAVVSLVRIPARAFWRCPTLRCQRVRNGC